MRLLMAHRILAVLSGMRLPHHGPPRAGERGQTTAEYALVIIGAAAVALLLLAWATDTGTIAGLLDKVVGSVANMVN